MSDPARTRSVEGVPADGSDPAFPNGPRAIYRSARHDGATCLTCPRPTDGGAKPRSRSAAKNDAIDELHIDIYVWDAIVTECVIPVVDGQQVPPPAIDVARGLSDLRGRIKNAGEAVAGDDLARLGEYEHYCGHLQDVFAAAENREPEDRSRG